MRWYVVRSLRWCWLVCSSAALQLRVSPETGDFTIVGSPFNWPESAGDGCPVGFGQTGVKQALHVSPDAPFVNVWSLSFA